MGGEIYLNSVENQGSEFSVILTFPIAKSVKTPEKMGSNLVGNLGNVRILVAEDDLINRTLIYEMLSRRCLDSTVVENGLELVEEYKLNKYDALLIDINMPVMDGLEATEKIRKFDKSIPITDLTAAVLPEEKENYYKIGIDAIV
jgi:CheY-like chemotaxis protein